MHKDTQPQECPYTHVYRTKEPRKSLMKHTKHKHPGAEPWTAPPHPEQTPTVPMREHSLRAHGGCSSATTWRVHCECTQTQGTVHMVPSSAPAAPRAALCSPNSVGSLSQCVPLPKNGQLQPAPPLPPQPSLMRRLPACSHGASFWTCPSFTGSQISHHLPDHVSFLHPSPAAGPPHTQNPDQLRPAPTRGQTEDTKRALLGSGEAIVTQPGHLGSHPVIFQHNAEQGLLKIWHKPNLVVSGFFFFFSEPNHKP